MARSARVDPALVTFRLVDLTPTHQPFDPGTEAAQASGFATAWRPTSGASTSAPAPTRVATAGRLVRNVCRPMGGHVEPPISKRATRDDRIVSIRAAKLKVTGVPTRPGMEEGAVYSNALRTPICSLRQRSKELAQRGAQFGHRLFIKGFPEVKPGRLRAPFPFQSRTR